jgi:hypothetical protein
MKNEFANYEQSLALKELGFDEQCYGHYDSTGELNTIEEYARAGADILHMLSKKFNSESYMKEMCLAPLKQQAFRWFRDKHKLVFFVNMVSINIFYYVIDIYPSDTYKTYEEAEIACIDRLIEIIKNKNNK